MDKMYLVITLRKEVPDRDTGKALYELVKERMVDHPDVEVHGLVSNHFDLEEPG
ncbi:hypothetical protein ES703_26303 [subsurface metagenome]